MLPATFNHTHEPDELIPRFNPDTGNPSRFKTDKRF